MGTLRKKLIRLAAANPELRPQLLPLLKVGGGFEQAAKQLAALAKKLPNASIDFSPNWKLVTVSGGGPTAYFSVTYRESPKDRMGLKLLEVEMKPYGDDEVVVEITDVVSKRTVAQTITDPARLRSMVSGDLQRAWKSALRRRGRQAAKDKPKMPSLRSPYYQMSDGISALESAVSDNTTLKKDQSLKRHLKNLDRARDQLVRYMNVAYVWD